MNYEPTYCEEVAALVEIALQCSTSDAQGVIGAYALTQYGHRQNGIMDAITWTMDDLEDEGVRPEEAARIVLSATKS